MDSPPLKLENINSTVMYGPIKTLSSIKTLIIAIEIHINKKLVRIKNTYFRDKKISGE